MVFFSCDGCAEMLKKSQVDGHAYRCRSCYSVSCVDCNVSFPGDEYRSHTSCMTESERYEKTGGSTSKNNNKKQKKLSPQEVWMEVINQSIETAPERIRTYITKMSCMDNIPRKEKQFYNFINNSFIELRNHNNKILLTEIWNHFQAVRKQQQQQKQENKQQQGNDDNVEKESNQSTTTNGIVHDDSTDKADNNTIIDDDTELNESKNQCDRHATSSNSHHNQDNKTNKKKNTIDDQLSSSHNDNVTTTTKNNTKSKNNTNAKILPNKKIVRKVIKRILLKSKDYTMPLKLLRKGLVQELSLDDGSSNSSTSKEQIKKLIIDTTTKNKKRFVIEGKTIRLLVLPTTTTKAA